MSSTRKVGVIVAIGVGAVVIGLLAGRSCAPGAAPDARAQAAPPVDAGLAAAPVDAGVVAAVAAVAVVVDAGTALPVVPLEAAAEPRGDSTRRTPRTRPEPAPVVARVEPPAPTPEPAKTDAGPPPLVDAGQPVVDAGVRAQHQDLQPEAMPSAPLTITYVDELGAWLKLTQVRVFVDGKRVVDLNDAAGIAMADRTAKVIHDTALFPGHHQVRVESIYIGKANGLFSYMEGYRFKLRDMVVVEVSEGRKTRVAARAWDKGGLEQWENRPAMTVAVAP